MNDKTAAVAIQFVSRFATESEEKSKSEEKEVYGTEKRDQNSTHTREPKERTKWMEKRKKHRSKYAYCVQYFDCLNCTNR